MSIVRSCKVENNINNRSTTLFVAVLASFLTPFMVSAVNIAIPSIGSEFDANVILLSWIPTGYLLTAAIFALPFGRIADIYGQKKIFLSGIIIFTVTSFLCGISPSILSLIFFRILQGMGSAMIFVTSLAIITSIYPKKGRGKAIGLNVASVYIGLSIGPFIGGLITQYFGWRSIFLVIIPFGVFAILLTLTQIRGSGLNVKVKNLI